MLAQPTTRLRNISKTKIFRHSPAVASGMPRPSTGFIKKIRLSRLLKNGNQSFGKASGDETGLADGGRNRRRFWRFMQDGNCAWGRSLIDEEKRAALPEAEDRMIGQRAIPRLDRFPSGWLLGSEIANMTKPTMCRFCKQPTEPQGCIVVLTGKRSLRFCAKILDHEPESDRSLHFC